MDIKNKISFCATFAKRIYESDHQTVFNSVKNSYPDCDFHLYHENSFELEKYNQEIIFNHVWDNLHLHDIFDCYGGLRDFLNSSPFKDVHKLGTPGGHVGLGEKREDHFNRQSIFWFRKVLAVRHAIEACKTPILIFLDADTNIVKNLDNTFIDYLSEKDFVCLKRPPHASEGIIDTGVMAFNLAKNGAEVAKEWYNYFIEGEAFKEKIWADHFIMTSVVNKLEKERPDIQIGGFDALYGAPFNHVYDYIGHAKGPLHKDRDDGFEGV